jgi:hypothetical protein
VGYLQYSLTIGRKILRRNGRKIPNGIPPFDGINFEYWSNRMETYLKNLGAYVWFSVFSGYNALKKPKIVAQKEAKRNNKLAIDTILDGLTD